MRGTEKTIYVYADWKGGTPVPVGRLYAQESRGKEVFSFEYADTWLDHPPMALDPELALYRGRQYMPLDRTQFGVFSDSSPDRWGRLLMQRREAIRAKNAGETISLSSLGCHAGCKDMNLYKPLRGLATGRGCRFERRFHSRKAAG